MKKERQRTLEQLFETILTEEKPELTQKENMIKFYASQTGTSEEAAEEAVNGILTGVAYFSDQLEEFKSDKEAAKTNLIVSLRKALEGKSMEEQYELLREILYTLHSLSMETMKGLSGELKDKEERMESIRGDIPIVEAVDLTPELIEDMINQVSGGIEACGSISLIRSFAETGSGDKEAAINIMAFEESEKRDEFIAAHWDDMKVKNNAALALYIMYQRGDVPELPEGLNAEAVGIIAAADIECGNTVRDAKNGTITWDKAMDILKTIAFIAATGLVIYAAVSVLIGYASLALLAPTISACLIVIGLGYLTFRGMMAVADGVMEGVRDISELVVIPAEILRGAVKILSSWASGLADWVRSAFGGLRSRQRETASHRNTAAVES